MDSGTTNLRLPRKVFQAAVKAIEAASSVSFSYEFSHTPQIDVVKNAFWVKKYHCSCLPLFG